MEKVMMIGCGEYIDSGYGCQGEWRCLKAVALGEGDFKGGSSQVISFIRSECPGRTLIANLNMTMKLVDIRPDKIYLSSCLANSVPTCPYFKPGEIAALIKEKKGIEAVSGTHDYH